jgi:hypothetical protein
MKVQNIPEGGIVRKTELLHFNLLSVIHKIEGLEIPPENPTLLSSVRFCKEQA